MQILRSKIVHHFKPYLIAVIIALQIQSIYVAFDLNRSLEEKTASYLDEAAVLASTVLEQRLRTLGNLMRHPHTLGDVSCTISASIGVARFPNDATDYKDLEARADLALYKAKHRGKNRHVYYEKAD